MLNFLRRRREAERADMDRLIRDAIRSESDKLQANLSEWREANARLTTSLATAQREAAGYKARLRDQTEADLIAVSLKILAKYVKGEPRDSSLETHQATYQQLLVSLQGQAAAAPYGPYGPYGGALASLGGGLGSIFGAH